MALFADFSTLRALQWILVAAVLAAVAAPDAADAGKAGAAVAVGGGYDGIWNVLIITQAGSCDPAYSYPFRVSGGRISTMGPANVSGSVGRGWRCCREDFGRRQDGVRQWQARRQHRRGPLDCQSVERKLQRQLAGHAGVTVSAKKMARQIA